MKISVIIPCFNVEKYIDRCLDSVVSQTISLSDIEIICVDDNSEDSTYEKLLAWDKTYPDNFIIIRLGMNSVQTEFIRDNGNTSCDVMPSSSSSAACSETFDLNDIDTRKK